MKKIDELRWIRVFTPDHVPHYLIEQIKGRDYSVEDFFRYHQINCLTQSEKGIVLNPFNHLYVLADKENQVKGMLWFNVDPLSKDIIVQTFSMHRDYWGKGQAIKKLADHIQQIRIKAKLNKIYWITDHPKHSMRYGFKPSKSILMEYDPDKEKKNGKDNNGVSSKSHMESKYDGINSKPPVESKYEKHDVRGSKPRGKCGTSNSRATELSKPSDGGTKSNGTTNESRTVSGDVPAVVC